MRRALGLLVLLSLGGAVAQASASASADFVANGLWRIVYDIHGPMGMHTQRIQYECWLPDGTPTQGGWMFDGTGQAPAVQAAGKDHWVMHGIGGARPGPGGATYAVHNEPLQSTVDVRAAMQIPGGPWSMHDHKVFSVIGSVLHAAIERGQGHSAFAGVPVLDETWSERGHRIARRCPLVLPAAGVSTLQPAHVAALDAMQRLAHQMQAQDPHPDGG